MQAMRIIETTAKQWSLQHALRPLLCAAGAVNVTGQNKGKHHVGVYSKTQGYAITGGRFEVRQPDIDETPLSEAEKQIAEREGWDD